MVPAISLSVGLVLVNANPEVVDGVGNVEVDVDDVADMEVTMLQLKTEVTTKKKVITPPENANTWTSAHDDIRAFLMAYGYGAEDVERAAEMVAPWEDASDRRQAASHFMRIQEENAELGLGQEGAGLSLAQTNASTGYFAESDSLSLWGGGRFLGPIWNTKCRNPAYTQGGDVGSCAQRCEDSSCLGFAINGGNCEFYDDCQGHPDQANGFMMYVRNTEGIEPHYLPPRHVGGESASFFVIGDWGGITSPQRASMHYVQSYPQGSDRWNFHHYAQENVARRMGEVGAERAPSLVVNAGDNFYWGGINHWTRGGHGVHDNFWNIGFEDVYTHPSLQVPWIGILGNHDFGGVGCFSDMQAQFDRTSLDLLRNNKWKMPSPYFNHRTDYDGFSLEVFMLDSNIEDAGFGARGGGVCQQRLCGGAVTADPHECVAWFHDMVRAQREWLPGALAASTATWKVIVMHHKAAGSEANFLRPLIAQHNVHMVVGSHTHEMAYFSRYNNIEAPLLVVGAGGGAQTNPGCGGAEYCGGTYGFAEVGITADEMAITIHECTGGSPLTRYICTDGREQAHSC